MSKLQKQKSIRSLHESAREAIGVEKILEISSKSEDDLGVRLSAFNLMLKRGSRFASVEVLFQGSKVFSNGGPFTDIYEKSSREAKRDARLHESGTLTGFHYEGRNWELMPQTLFYDWLYLSALSQNPALAESLLQYEAFTDIEFNPSKSINCQASSAALYKALWECNLRDTAMSSPEAFKAIFSATGQRVSTQGKLI